MKTLNHSWHPIELCPSEWDWKGTKPAYDIFVLRSRVVIPMESRTSRAQWWSEGLSIGYIGFSLGQASHWLVDWLAGWFGHWGMNPAIGRHMMVWVTQACASLSTRHGPLSHQRWALRHQHPAMREESRLLEQGSSCTVNPTETLPLKSNLNNTHDAAPSHQKWHLSYWHGLWW